MLKNLLLSTFLSLRAHKLRVFLTMVGIIIGIAAVVTVSALGEGLKKANMDMMDSANANNIRLIYKDVDPEDDGPESESDYYSQYYSNFNFDKIDMKRLRSIEGVDNIYGDYGYGSFSSEEELFSTAAYFELSSERSIEPAKKDNNVTYGRDFSEEDMDKDVAILDYSTMKDTFKVKKPQEILGKAVSIDNNMFKVIGVKKAQDYDAMTSYDASLDRITVPKQAFNKIAKNKKMTALKLQVNADADRQQVVEQASNIMKEYHPDLTGVFEEDRSNEKMREQMEAFLGTLIMGLMLITAISLLVGGIGVMNIMYVSVSERKREIGIRRAIGAKPRNILMQFLLEAAFITLIGGVIGIFAGYGFSQLISVFADGLTPILSPKMAIMAAGVSTGIGVVFGVIPALNAARMDPIKAIYM